MSGQSDDSYERQRGWRPPWMPGGSAWMPGGSAWLPEGTVPPLFDGSAVTRGAMLYGNAVRDQMVQWQRAFEKLARGAYGPQEASADLQESTRRAIGLCTQLAGLWWGSGTARAGSTGPGEPTAPAGPPGSPAGPTAPPSTHPERAAPPSTRPRRAAPPAATGRPAAAAPPARSAAPSAPAEPRPARRTARRSALDEAQRFLRRELAGGPRPARELQERAQAAGISKTTLQRAKRKLGIEGRRAGFGPDSRVVWELPAGM